MSASRSEKSVKLESMGPLGATATPNVTEWGRLEESGILQGCRVTETVLRGEERRVDFFKTGERRPDIV